MIKKLKTRLWILRTDWCLQSRWEDEADWEKGINCMVIEDKLDLVVITS